MFYVVSEHLIRSLFLCCKLWKLWLWNINVVYNFKVKQKMNKNISWGGSRNTNQISGVYCTHYLFCTALPTPWNFSYSFATSRWSYNQSLYSIVTVLIISNIRRKTESDFWAETINFIIFLYCVLYCTRYNFIVF